MANCCCPHSLSAARFFSFFAKRYRKRFAGRGFEPSQKQLLQGIQDAGISDASILEIGSGVGHLHQSLLERSAATAVGVDLAENMVKEAERWAEERGLRERTTYLSGDYMQLADAIDAADITIMDKVVCCYPDAFGLVHRSLDKTKRVYALTYPLNKRFIRVGVGIVSLVLKLFGSSFRPYVHSPEDIEKWINQNGFVKKFEDNTTIWLTQVYVKA